ncbi:MAG: SHS2 domain-containing protein [Pirellulaceae bacterium]|jgi:SHS2 domain-containing protein
MYETFDHTADLGLRVRAASVEQLFEEAAMCLFEMMVVNLEDVKSVVSKTVEITANAAIATDSAAGMDLLLFDWLNELLYLFESEQLLLSKFHASFHCDKLTAEVSGQVMDFDRHEMDHEVKAITYHQLRVELIDDAPEDEKWLAELIVDI